METINISLEELAALVRGATITCGPVLVKVARADLDGLRAAVTMNDTMVAMARGPNGEAGE